MKPVPSIIVGAAVAVVVAVGANAAPEGFAIHSEPRAVPDMTFEDGDGSPRRLADFAGRVVLLNVWATWCVPCRDEMPTLDRLQAELGGSEFVVVALSIDRAGPGVVRAFYDEIGVAHLDLYIDASGSATRILGVVGLPTTLLIDRDGREVGRLVGPAEWDAPEMLTFIEDRLGARSGRSTPPAGSASEPAAQGLVPKIVRQPTGSPHAQEHDHD